MLSYHLGPIVTGAYEESLKSVTVGNRKSDFTTQRQAIIQRALDEDIGDVSAESTILPRPGHCVYHGLQNISGCDAPARARGHQRPARLAITPAWLRSRIVFLNETGQRVTARTTKKPSASAPSIHSTPS